MGGVPPRGHAEGHGTGWEGRTVGRTGLRRRGTDRARPGWPTGAADRKQWYSHSVTDPEHASPQRGPLRGNSVPGHVSSPPGSGPPARQRASRRPPGPPPRLDARREVPSPGSAATSRPARTTMGLPVRIASAISPRVPRLPPAADDRVGGADDGPVARYAEPVVGGQTVRNRFPAARSRPGSRPTVTPPRARVPWHTAPITPPRPPRTTTTPRSAGGSPTLRRARALGPPRCLAHLGRTARVIPSLDRLGVFDRVVMDGYLL